MATETPAAPPAARKRIPHEERRTQILETAIDLFASRGFKGTTTREIAHAAGVSEGIIFRHFATKEALYDAIIAHTAEKRTRLYEQDGGTEGMDLESLMRAFARSYLARNRQDSSFLRLMLYSALEDHKFQEKFFEIYRSPCMAAMRGALEDGIRRGIYRPVDPAFHLRAFFWVLLHYCISRYVSRARRADLPEEEAFVDQAVTGWLNGLRTTSPPEAG
jgi:AcrR family transcriptional regulator